MILRSRFVVTRPGSVVERREVRIEATRIAAVVPRERFPSGGPCVLDFGDAAILPGLVNAHVHLELSGLRGRVPRGAGFTDWLRQLIAAMKTHTAEGLEADAARGIHEAIRSGTTALGEISSHGCSLKPLALSRVRAVVFEEVLGLSKGALESARSTLARRLEATYGKAELARRGITPHAPYSVSPDLFRWCVAEARRLGLPLAVHVAETPEEIEFLRTGDGPFRALLEELGALADGFEPPGCSPIEYMKRLGVLDADRPALLIHANHLSNADVALVRDSRAAVVYCPRSHRFFGHEGHPYRTLMRAGVPVALGTDSLASNDSLDLLAEMRAVAALDDAPPACEILAMATTAGAIALSTKGTSGAVEPGRDADLTVVSLPRSVGASDVEDAIVRDEAVQVLATIVQGRLLYERQERDEACSTSTSCANTPIS